MAEVYDKPKERETESSSETSSSSYDHLKSHYSLNEIKNQMSQCLKLIAENKINDKNAFQLQMIDFLLYALRKQDPSVMNLQMASVCLDASSKIYGFRVDKVYSDLMKIVGLRRKENLNNKDEDDKLNLSKSQLRKRRKKSRHHILSTVQELHGSLNIYNSKSFVNCNRDTQTSNLLIQASLPQHVTHGIAINLFNDVLLDKIPINGYKSSKTLVQVIDDFTSNELCPSQRSFKFLECFSSVTVENSYKCMEDFTEFFSFNNSDTNSDIMEDNRISPISDNYENELLCSLTNNDQETIQDFQNAIENHPNPNAIYEYSYMQPNHHINWAKQSHWKVILNKNSDVEKDKQMEYQKQTIKGKEKNLKISYTKNKKKQAKTKFTLINGNKSSKVLQIIKKQWTEDKLIEPQNFEYDKKRLFNFFNKADYEKYRADTTFKDNSITNIRENNLNNILNLSQLNKPLIVEENNFENSCKEETSLPEGRPSIPCNTSMLENDEAFINNNLVAAPKLIEKLLIPYSKRAKKINMSQFTEALWKNLYISDEKNNNCIKTKELSSLYLEIPKSLSKDAVKSLSPGLAFISLLHLANERCLFIENQSDFADVIVKNFKRSR